MWLRCQKFVEDTYMAWKRYNNAKGQTEDNTNKFTEKVWNLYMKALEAQTAGEKNEHIQQVRQHNPTLMAMVQAQQKKIDELIE